MSSELVIQAGDDGRAVIRLREPGSTGYEWVVVDLPEPLRLVANRYDADAVAGDDVVDSGGQHIFTVIVPEPGSYVVKFSLRQAWEAEPLDSQDVRVVRD